MSKKISIVASRRGRDALGCQILGSVAGAITCAALLIYQPHFGNSSVAAPPPKIPRSPVTSDGTEKPRGGSRQVVIKADDYNQCYIDAFANGRKFTFLADSGASGVYFSTKQARRLGYDPDNLAFDHSYFGWGWRVRGATVRLKSLNIAGFEIRDVNAAIDGLGAVTDVNGPLMGSPVLKVLSFQIHDGYCTLTIPRDAAAVAAP